MDKNPKGNLHSMLSSYEQSQQNMSSSSQTQEGTPSNLFPNHSLQMQLQSQIESQLQSQIESQLQNQEMYSNLNQEMYHLNHQETNDDNHHMDHGEPSDMSIQLDAMCRDRSSTIGSFRDRGLTFGSVSEFDLGLGFEDGVSSSGVLPGVDADMAANVDGVHGVHGKGENGNDQGSSGGGGGTFDHYILPPQDASFQVHGQQARPQAQSQPQAQAQLLQSKQAAQPPLQQQQQQQQLNRPFQRNSQQQQLQQQQQQEDDVRSSCSNSSVQGDTSSHTQYFSGMFGTHGNDTSGGTALLGHTPPSAMATSYEGKHFGKRMRAGSISGRLRSMSDLEDRGIIDRHQKGVLKDLIISGDDDLQAALDKWEEGDKSALESIVSRLKTRHSSDIDLLGDLDLDFLSMGNADFGVGMMSDMNSIGEHHPMVSSKTMSIPIPGKSMGMSVSGSNPGSGASTPRIRDSSSSPMIASHAGVEGGGGGGVGSYDGIGELDFNGDYAGAVERTPYQQAVYNQNANARYVDSHAHSHLQPQAYSRGTKFRSDSLSEFQRNRANSLAFGILLDEPNPNELQDPVGKWMDRTPGTTTSGIPEESKPLKKRVSSHVVGANGGLYIVNDPIQDIMFQPPALNSGKMTKAEIAAMKRREREERKAQREAEKLAKKEKKEEEARLKKAMKAMKQEKKPKKAETKKKKEEAVIEEEQKIIVSGTGRPRSLSDPNLSIGLDDNGLMHIDHPPDWVGAYSPDSRKIRIERFLAKRDHRVWVKKVKYDVRKSFADSRLRVKGRFVKKEDELLMRDLMSLT